MSAHKVAFDLYGSESSCSTDTDVMSEGEETSCDGLPELPTPFGFMNSQNSSFSLCSESHCTQTPNFTSPPPFIPDYSPYVSSPRYFSPFPSNTPSTPARNGSFLSPITPSVTPPTPNLSTPKPEKHVQISVPTPDFTALKKQPLSTRKLKRTASSNEIPETPKKQRVGQSRLSGNVTPARPTTPAIHTPNHFSHHLTPKVSEQEVKHHLDNFEMISKIGQGSFSNVFKARCKSDGNTYAIKILKRPISSDSQRHKLIRELKYVKELNNPHVLSYIFCWEQDQIVHYQMEWCAGGSLSSFITQWQKENPNVYFEESLLWRFLTDMILGLDHIHSHDLIHNDIKPGNIFIDNDKNLKIGDFGLASKASSGFVEEEGDSRYLAPEVLRDKSSKASDVFSIGATMFELACLIEMPSCDENFEILRQGNVSSLSSFPNYSSEFKNVVDVMMHPKYKQRPTTRDLLSHPKIIENLEFRRRVNPTYFAKALTPIKPAPRETPPFINSLMGDDKEQQFSLKRKPPRRNLLDCFNNVTNITPQ